MDTPLTDGANNASTPDNEGAGNRPTNHLSIENYKYLLSQAADALDRKDQQIDDLLIYAEEQEAVIEALHARIAEMERRTAARAHDASLARHEN